MRGWKVAAATGSRHGSRLAPRPCSPTESRRHPHPVCPPRNHCARQVLRDGLKLARANPYLVVFEDGFPYQQTTSWEAKGQPNAP